MVLLSVLMATDSIYGRKCCLCDTAHKICRTPGHGLAVVRRDEKLSPFSGRAPPSIASVEGAGLLQRIDDQEGAAARLAFIDQVPRMDMEPSRDGCDSTHRAWASPSRAAIAVAVAAPSAHTCATQIEKRRMPISPESRAIAKLAWEAAIERLGNALKPPPGYPDMTPEALAECFWVAQVRLNELRAAYDIGPNP